MIKAILIEDRVQRQNNYLKEKSNELNNLPFLKNVKGGNDYVEIKSKLNNKEYSFLDDYSIIMLHRSAFETKARNGLLDYLRNKSKKVIFFSGGISNTQCSKIGNLEFLLINVTTFYSENLLFFLKNEGQNLLELAFGKNWKISILVDAYEKIILYLKYYSKRPWPKIESDLMLNNWVKDEYYAELITKELIDKIELQNIAAKLNLDLQTLLGCI